MQIDHLNQKLIVNIILMELGVAFALLLRSKYSFQRFWNGDNFYEEVLNSLKDYIGDQFEKKLLRQI